METMITVFASIFAGLGLFFVGLQMLTENVKRLAGRRFRQAVAAWTRKPSLGMLSGLLLKALTNSSTVTTFILISLLKSGSITVMQALPVIIGQNIGGAALVYLASLDIKLFILFLIGITGLLITSERAIRLKTTAGALLGVGLLFLGLNLIQAGAAPMSDASWFRTVLQKTTDSYTLAFLIGGLLTFLSQSTAAISVLAITMTKAGLLTINQTIMIIYGCHMGSSLTTYLLSLKLHGRPRQIAMYQTIYNVASAAVLIPLFFLEVYGGVPLVRNLVTSLADRVELQMAHLYFLYNFLAGVILLPFLGPSGRLLERLWPPTAAEETAKLQYIHDHALSDPETALDLAVMEQKRLIAILPGFIEALRSRSAKSSSLPVLVSLRESFTTVADAVAEFLSGIGEANPAPATYERLNRAINDQSMIRLIEGSIWELASAIDEGRKKRALEQFQESVVEAVDAVLLTAVDAVSGGDDFCRTLFYKITGDQSETMQKLREAYLSGGDCLGPEEKVLFLKITNICERLFWLLHSFSKRC
jgi:phosphate:Na+ symporter